MSETPEGGSPACFLDDVDENGRITDPASHIHIATGGPTQASWIRYWIGPEGCSPEGYSAVPVLEPLPSEDGHSYATRLELVVCRTAAWAIALRALDEPVELTFPESTDTEMQCVLLRYIHQLLT